MVELYVTDLNVAGGFIIKCKPAGKRHFDQGKSVSKERRQGSKQSARTEEKVKLPVKVETSGLERLGITEGFVISDNTEASFPTTIATPSLTNTMQTDANVFLYDATAIAAIEDGNSASQDVPATPTSFEELVAMLDIPGFTTTTEDDHTQCATLDPGTKWPI